MIELFELQPPTPEVLEDWWLDRLSDGIDWDNLPFRSWRGVEGHALGGIRRAHTLRGFGAYP